MTYLKQSTVAAADYNSLAGNTAAAAPSAVFAANKAGYLWGVGFGDRGYGRTSPSLGSASPTNLVSQEWQDLRTAISSIAAWQGTVLTTLPTAAAFNTKANIAAFPAGNIPYDIVSALAAIDANRLNFQATSMALSGVAASSTQSVAWGAGGNGTSISAIFNATFADENSTRYYFNTGGDVRISLNHPNTTTAQDQAWNVALNNLTIALKANSTVKISGLGTAANIGYYQLTAGWQTILTGNCSGAYAANTFTVEASAIAITGANGGKGNVISFRITLTDNFTGGTDVVSAGTNASVTYYRSTTMGIASPSVATITNFSGSNPVAQIVTITVVGNITNFNVFNNRFGSQHGSSVTVNGSYSTGSTVNVVVNSGVVVGSNDTSSYAFDTGNGWANTDTLTLTNNGYIVGKGGHGTYILSLDAGISAGGPALNLQKNISIANNSGYIYSGGGGGGWAGGGYGGWGAPAVGGGGAGFYAGAADNGGWGGAAGGVGGLTVGGVGGADVGGWPAPGQGGHLGQQGGAGGQILISGQQGVAGGQISGQWSSQEPAGAGGGGGGGASGGYGFIPSTNNASGMYTNGGGHGLAIQNVSFASWISGANRVYGGMA